MAVDLRALVREIPDFPQPGIGFKDITPVLADPAGLDAAVTGLCALAPPDVDVVIGAEARGFLLGPALARELGAGFVLARKPGKLPRAHRAGAGAHRRGRERRAGPRPRRSPGDRRHGPDAVPARRAARRDRRRVRIPDRADVP